MIDFTAPASPLLNRLRTVYGDTVAAELAPAIGQLVANYAGRIPPRPTGWSERDALLITYGDAITGADGVAPLTVLHDFLRRHCQREISFIHLLPFYPFTSDDGFSVTDFRQVRADLGNWDDIARLADDYRLVFDGVINHVSEASDYMNRYRTGDPACADFFIALDPQTDTSSVLRTRNLPLLHDYPTVSGVKWLWTTFSRDQLDLNYRNPRVLLEILDVLLGYAQRGAAMIRLDAIPYLWKELGTSCAHLPQTHELIKLIRDVYDLAAPHVLLLTETNVPHRENIKYFGAAGDEAQMIYNFSLPPLIVWSLFKGDAVILSEWARSLEFIGPRATYLNITATHDGIGMRPTEGLLSEPERAELVQLAYDRGGDMTGKRNQDGTVSPYELNLSYFDAINDPRAAEPLELQVRRFLLAQAIPLALIGLPGIYLHSLLGSRNDHAGVQRTGRARSINRQQLTLSALEQELADADHLRAHVLTGYLRLLRIRGNESAFHPDARQEIPDHGPAIFAVCRQNPATGRAVLALHNVSAAPVTVNLLTAGHDLLGTGHWPAGRAVLQPYQIVWLARAV
ncbi:MAG: sugar phosphorylase [Verrucomicrobiales bacterium]|jgi:sucrose phosphorylase|nr:sugar phosphorylase [Verrucomicrobiales bacterium]